MKKSISLILILTMVFTLFLAGCGKNENTESQDDPESKADAVEYYSVGEDISTDYFSFCVTETAFADCISYDTSNHYLEPVAKGTSQAFDANDGYQWLYYTVKYQYSGKSSLSSISSLFTPRVKYLDYTFDSNYFVFLNKDSNWYILNDDNEAIGHPLLKGLSSIGLTLNYEPLSDNTYEIHGIIQVPVKAINDTENDMILELYNVDSVDPSGIFLKWEAIRVQ